MEPLQLIEAMNAGEIPVIFVGGFFAAFLPMLFKTIAGTLLGNLMKPSAPKPPAPPKKAAEAPQAPGTSPAGAQRSLARKQAASTQTKLTGPRGLSKSNAPQGKKLFGA